LGVAHGRDVRMAPAVQAIEAHHEGPMENSAEQE
jgi:hypothetical protein